MSDVLQLILNTRSQGATASGPKGDAGTDGFAQLFEQQMSAEPVGDARPVEVVPARAGRPAPAKGPVKETDAGPPKREPLPEQTEPTPPPVQFQIQATAQAAAASQPVPPPLQEAQAAGGTPEMAGPATAQPAATEAGPGLPQVTRQVPVMTPLPQPDTDPVSEGGAHPVTPAKVTPATEAVLTTTPTMSVSPPRILGPAAPAQPDVTETDAGPESALPDTDHAHTAKAGTTPAGERAAAAVAAAFLPDAATGIPLDAAALAKAGLVPLANPVLLAALAPATAPGAVAAMTATPEVPALSGESPGGATAPGGTPAGTPAPKATQAEMIARMVAVAKLLSKANGDRTFLLKLNPPDLGRVQVRLQVENGRVEASVHTETHAARHAILQNLEQLRASLLEQGLHLGRFDVNVEGQDAGTAQFSKGQGGGRRRSPEEELADSLLAVPLAGRRTDENEESGEVPVSDAMAVDLLA